MRAVVGMLWGQLHGLHTACPGQAASPQGRAPGRLVGHGQHLAPRPAHGRCPVSRGIDNNDEKEPRGVPSRKNVSASTRPRLLKATRPKKCNAPLGLGLGLLFVCVFFLPFFFFFFFF